MVEPDDSAYADFLEEEKCKKSQLIAGWSEGYRNYYGDVARIVQPAQVDLHLRL